MAIINEKTLEEIMALPKAARYAYLYGAGANTLQMEVLKSRETLEGEKIVAEYVKRVVLGDPNPVQVWLKNEFRRPKS